MGAASKPHCEIDLIEPPEDRTALRAALHLDPTNRETSIDRRLQFARDRHDFGVRRNGQPHGYDALRTWWGDGVRRLGENIEERLDYLRSHPNDWHEYLAPSRNPPVGVQPVFVELFVATVTIKGRFVHRRVSERVVTAQEDGVEFYTARALPENDAEATGVPVRAVWGCRAERVPSLPGERILTRLWFPVPLHRGEHHYFSSVAEHGYLIQTDRRAIDVEVDHHGIAAGLRKHGVIPVSGLTIRIQFDVDELPDACWWYEDVNEPERYNRPAPGDPRLLTPTSQGYLEHTFAEECQPLAHYGVSIGWPVG